MKKISAAAVELGRKGGKSTSEAKQSAARANGAKGGRPPLCVVKRQKCTYAPGYEYAVVYNGHVIQAYSDKAKAVEQCNRLRNEI